MAERRAVGSGAGQGERRTSVLVVGVSTRAIAESAARAGYDVTSLDAFADLDQPRGARALSMRRDFGVAYSTRAAARVAARLPADAVAYAAGLENAPESVETLARGRALWGNTPAVLRMVRDPLRLARELRARGLPAPATRAGAPAAGTGGDARAWLRKARASGGGTRVVRWRGEPVGRSDYLQERISGVPGSVVFVADGRDAAPFAMTRQLVGERDFGAGGFRYCGSILAAAGDPILAGSGEDARLLEAATTAARAAAAAFGLVGVGGVDFIARAGLPFPIEVNPRWSASMELAERAYGIALFAAHVAGCAGTLPTLDLPALRRRPGAIGKAVLYARRAVTAGDTRRWLADGDIRDVPHPGERIPRGRPICTIFARGRDGADCRAALAARAAELYAQLEGRRAARARRSA